MSKRRRLYSMPKQPQPLSCEAILVFLIAWYVLNEDRVLLSVQLVLLRPFSAAGQKSHKTSFWVLWSWKKKKTFRVATQFSYVFKKILFVIFPGTFKIANVHNLISPFESRRFCDIIDRHDTSLRVVKLRFASETFKTFFLQHTQSYEFRRMLTFIY